MSWQLVLLAHSIISAFGAIVARLLSRNGNKYSYVTVPMVFAASFAIGVVNLSLSKSVLKTDSFFDFWPLFVAEGFLFASRAFLFLSLSQLVSASVAIIINSLGTIFVVLIATIFLDEGLSPGQTLGAALMIAASIVVSLKIGKNNKIRMTWSGLCIGFFMAIAFGFAITIEKHLLDKVGIDNYLFFGWGSQLIAALIISYLNRARFIVPRGKFAIYSISYALVYATAGALFVLSLKGADNASRVASLSGLKVLLTVILAYIFLKERQDNLKIAIGVILSCLGLYLLFR